MCVYVYIYICIYIYIYIHIHIPERAPERSRRDPPGPVRLHGDREFTKGGLVKAGPAIYAFPLCNCNALGSVVNVQIENMPNCQTPLC